MKGKSFSKLAAHRVRHRSGDSRDLAAQLAPLEELRDSNEPAATAGSRVSGPDQGAIVVGVEQPEVVKKVAAAEDRNGALGLEPVVIVIVGLMLAFIMFIAWQISLMPRN